jgi:hypothetical protein
MMAANSAHAENMPVLIGSVAGGLLFMIVVGVAVGIVLYKAKKRAKAKQDKETEKETKTEVVKTDHIVLPNDMINPILRTHSIYRNSVGSNNSFSMSRVPHSVHHKKSFAPQLAPNTPTAEDMSSVPGVVKKPHGAFLEQYDLSSFNAMPARQHMRKLRRPPSVTMSKQPVTAVEQIPKMFYVN